MAGTLTIYVTRTRGHFWSYRPSKQLFLAVSGAQLVATFITVYGFSMAPIGWFWALAVWVYALAWLFINDFVKLAAYRLFDKSGERALVKMRKR